MCSIFGILDIKTDSATLRKSALEMSKRLRHRGPDWSGVYSSDKAILVHERLAIVDPGNGAQPLYNPERTHQWVSLPIGSWRKLADGVHAGTNPFGPIYRDAMELPPVSVTVLRLE